MIIPIPTQDVRNVAERALQRAGVPAPHAALQADLLLEAELKGRPSHGLLRLPRLIERIANGVASATATGAHSWCSRAFLDVDGQRGLGPVVATRALQEAAERSQETGVVVVAIRNNNHLGMLAWYAEHWAHQGMILLALSTSEALVHAWGGRSAMLGTNPIAMGIPTVDQPVVLDMATSLVSMGQIHDYAQRDQTLPAGWAIDAQGVPTTNAHAAKQGAIAPFGGAKGYALGLAIEVLVASLTQSAIGREVSGTLDSTTVCNKGDVFVLIRPPAHDAMTTNQSASFAVHGEVKQGSYPAEPKAPLTCGGEAPTARSEFFTQQTLAHRIAAYLDAVRASGDQVVIPGERARAERQVRLTHGVSLPQALWVRLNALADTTPSSSKEE